MESKNLVAIFTGSWKDEVKKLPKYQRKELVYAGKLYGIIDRFKFGIINKKQLRQQISELIKTK